MLFQTAFAEPLLQEYGLPSSHTLNSCLLNYYVIYFCLERGLIEAPTGRVLYVVASCWIAFIAFARLYLGMHTVTPSHPFHRRCLSARFKQAKHFRSC